MIFIEIDEMKFEAILENVVRSTVIRTLLGGAKIKHSQSLRGIILFRERKKVFLKISTLKRQRRRKTQKLSLKCNWVILMGA